MKASELRIGNLVQDKTGNVKTISGDTIAEIDGFDDRLLIEPVLLTEKWLDRFGLINRQIWVFEIFGNNDRGFHISSESGEWIFIKYVHHLQNLYFALTGKELEYEQN